MTLVDRYIAWHCVKAALAVLALLLVLFGFMSLTDELEHVGEGSFTAIDAVAVMLLTTPGRLIDLLPVTALLGATLGLGMLANHQELQALRAAGMSPWRLTRGLLVTAGVVVVAALLARGLLVPVAERQAQEFRSKKLPQTALGGTEFWSRHERRFIRVGGVDFGRIPRDIEIYELGERGRLERMVHADKADVLTPQEWVLHDVHERVLGRDSVAHRDFASLRWHSFLSGEQMETLIAPAHALSIADLVRYIREMHGSGVDTHLYQTLLWQQLALPPALIAMALLGVPLVLGLGRVRSSSLRATLGGAAGILFYLLERITSNLSAMFDLPPAPTALAPSLLLLVAACVALNRLR